MDEFSDGKAIFLKPDAIQYDKDGNEMAHWRFNQALPKQEPYGYFRYDIQLDAWVQIRDGTQGVAFYTAPKEWVGLTDEEIKEIIGPWGDTPIKGYTRELFNKIEAKLKEKNT
jgi:hypothetical protein